MTTRSLQKAKRAKNDEFYTQLKDIENELKHYKTQLKDKVIFCNCDDPFESNFFQYFAMKFKQLGLKRLIATCYAPSPIANKEIQLSFLGEEKEEQYGNKSRQKIISKAYKIELDDITDIDNSGSIDILDTKKILLQEKAKLDSGEGSKILSYLNGDGDFRSDECVELLKQADIVITNPPFSLFREYVSQLVEYDKKFLIIGSKNAITYKEVFKLIAEEKLWLGYGFNGGNAYFAIPDSNADRFAKGVFDEKTGLVKFRNCTWFTNLLVDKSDNPIIPYIKYEDGLKRGLYAKYDNYDAIEVSRVAEIPEDYYGAMGVPITFLDKWVPSVARADERERERGLHRAWTRQIHQGQQHAKQTNVHQRQRNLCQNHHQATSKSFGQLTEVETENLTALKNRTLDTTLPLSMARGFSSGSSSSEFEIIGVTESEGKGFSNGLWDDKSKVAQAMINGVKKFKRIFIRRLQ